MIRALGLKINRVVIDPGHGGSDQGTVGRRGLMEKDLVLDVAKRLGKLIEERRSGKGSEKDQKDGSGDHGQTAGDHGESAGHGQTASPNDHGQTGQTPKVQP